MKQQNIALFGIFRSGTNFTRTVMEWNYDCQLTTNLLGWKHGYYPIIVKRSVLKYPDANILFVTKSPFSSITSLYNYFQTNGRNIFSDKEWKGFLRKRFVTYDFFQDGSPQYRFANVVDFWNAMNWNFASIKRPGIISTHVKYESMLEDSVNYSQNIAKQLGLTPRFSNIESFKIPSKVTKNMGDQLRENESDYLTEKLFNSATYLNKDYYQQYDKDDLNFILDHIDMDLINHLGYQDEIARAKKMIDINS